MLGKGRIQEREARKVKIDAKDRKILFLLNEDARSPVSEIAKKVMISRDSVSYRIKRLQREGVILRTFPVVNYKLFGYNVFHVFITINERQKQDYEKFLALLENHPNVISIMEYNERWDIHVSLIARSIRDFDRMMTDITSRFHDVIAEKQVLENINNYKIEFLPYTENISLKESRKEKEVYTCNAKDMKILSILSQNARMSTYEIGEIMNIDADTVAYRIKKMKNANVIKRFSALINYSKLQYHWYTCALRMKTFDPTHERKFQRYIKDVPNIVRGVKTLGNWDVLLYIVVDDTKKFHKIVKDIKAEFYDIWTASETWIAYEEHVYNPLPEVLAGRAEQTE